MLESICILGVDDDFVKVSEGAASSEDILQSCPHSLEDVVLSVQMNAYIDAGIIG